LLDFADKQVVFLRIPGLAIAACLRLLKNANRTCLIFENVVGSKRSTQLQH